MDKEHIPMEHKVNTLAMKVIGKNVHIKERVNCDIKMAEYLKGSSNIMIEMAQVLWNWQMGKSSNKEFGKMMNLFDHFISLEIQS